MVHLSIQSAISALKNGQVIAYPTETVFGLGCDPNQPLAIQKLLELKKRPAQKGLILLASQFDFFMPYLDLTQLSDSEIKLIQQKQTQPTTWIVPKSKNTLPLISGDFDSIAIRLCEHPVVQVLSNALQSPIISTSANQTSKPVCMTVDELKFQFGIDFPIVNGFIDINAKPSCIFDVKKNIQIR